MCGKSILPFLHVTHPRYPRLGGEHIRHHGGASIFTRDCYSSRTEGIAFYRLEDTLQVLATNTKATQSNLQRLVGV